MRFTISRSGVELETSERRQRYHNYGWAKPSLIFAWPGELYRIVARRKISALIAENRRLRKAYAGNTPHPLARAVEWAFITWLDRRYPLPSKDPEG